MLFQGSFKKVITVKSKKTEMVLHERDRGQKESIERTSCTSGIVDIRDPTHKASCMKGIVAISEVAGTSDVHEQTVQEEAHCLALLFYLSDCLHILKASANADKL
ncbi:hypothetical protein SD71_06545 [Cohnella kolymensis]|uniref:Uncharacterized protein n=1 Tax=Cohnella kolymensis TaxID=1590652 RepID=A0ABR5A6E8_9BACL|nr:hypothetical protein SD71_06545 [Cohnella kolymensis]